MARFKNDKVGLDGWGEWDHSEKVACCDCGLVHDHQYRKKNGRLEVRSRRNERSTGQVRRHMKRKK